MKTKNSKITIKYLLNPEAKKPRHTEGFKHSIYILLTYKRIHYKLKSRIDRFCFREELEAIRGFESLEINQVIEAINGDESILLDTKQESLLATLESEKDHIMNLFNLFLENKVDFINNLPVIYDYSLIFFSEHFESICRKELATTFNEYFQSSLKFDFVGDTWEEYYDSFNRFIAFSCTTIPREDRIQLLDKLAAINIIRNFLELANDSFVSKGPTLVSYLKSNLRLSFLEKMNASSLSEKQLTMCLMADYDAEESVKDLVRIIIENL
jgi:hypothetical protein